MEAKDGKNYFSNLDFSSENLVLNDNPIYGVSKKFERILIVDEEENINDKEKSSLQDNFKSFLKMRKVFLIL